MADVAVVYNFGENPGGGDLVALDIIEALIENGDSVWLYTTRSSGIRKATEHFLKDDDLVDRIEVKNVNVMQGVKHPYNIYMITKGALEELKLYDLIIFLDDIPNPAQKLKRILVYTHYPHAARILLGKLVPYKYRKSVKWRLIWKLHSNLFKMLFLIDWNKPNIYALANSTLTEKHVAKSLKPAHLVKVYPPVLIEQIAKYLEKNRAKKENEIVYVGRIEPDKGIEDIIKALALIKNKDIKAWIIGFNFDTRYLRYLKSLARELGIEKRVTYKVNAAREEVLEILSRASILVHPARHEPFGIAVVEGMVAGCVPIVRKGLSGPWIDIIEKGRYGYGYANIHELAEKISEILTSKNADSLREHLVKRARIFSEQNFKRKIIEQVKNIT